MVFRHPPRTTAPASKIAGCRSAVLYKAYIPDRWLRNYIPRRMDDDHNDWRLPYISELNILRTNHQLHAEAAPFFYARNRFRLMLGIYPHVHCKGSAWDFVDDLASMSISKANLRLMRHIHLRVRIFDFPGDSDWCSGSPNIVLPDWNWCHHYAKSSYLDVKTALDRFADVMQGEHRLRSLSVRLHGFVLGRLDAVDRIQNALEPLGSIYGIQEVYMGRVTLDFAEKMVRVMQAKSLAVEKIPESYGKRKIRSSKGTQKKQSYKLQPYMASRYKFLAEDGNAGSGKAEGEVARRTKVCLRYALPFRVVLYYRLDSQGRVKFQEAIAPH
ncbi:MAG: hypothetical protein Q9186_004957 [Xanthomendoza sp. 1 TL-2023]